MASRSPTDLAPLGISKKAEGKEYSEVYLEPGAQIHFWAAKSESDPTPEGDIIKLCCPTMGATDLYLSNLRKLVELDAYGNELIQIDLASCSSLHTARLGSNLLGRITLPSVASLTCNVNDQKHTQGYSMDVKVEERPIWAIKPLDVEYESLVGQSMPQMD